MTSAQSKKRAAAALAAVFVAGVALGIAGARRAERSGRGPWQMTPRQYRLHLLETLAKRLSLTEAQQAKVEEILDEIGDRFESVSDAIEPEMEAIRAERSERIMLVLEPSQRTEYEAILEERRQRRERHRERHRERGGTAMGER